MIPALIVYLIAGLCILWITGENNYYRWYTMIFIVLAWPFITAWKFVAYWIEYRQYKKISAARPTYGEE